MTTVVSQGFICAQVEIRDGWEFKGLSEDWHAPRSCRVSFDSFRLSNLCSTLSKCCEVWLWMVFIQIFKSLLKTVLDVYVLLEANKNLILHWFFSEHQKSCGPLCNAWLDILTTPVWTVVAGRSCDFCQTHSPCSGLWQCKSKVDKISCFKGVVAILIQLFPWVLCWGGLSVVMCPYDCACCFLLSAHSSFMNFWQWSPMS